MLPRLILRPSFINNALCRVVTSELMIVREKGGKGSPSQSQGRRRPRDHRDYRVKFAPGSWVREKVILATQGKLDYHPGLNTAIDPRDFSIYALRSGTLVITTEKVCPNPDHDMAEKFYSDRKGQNIHKRFVNVIPAPTPQLFRLVDLV